MAVIGGSAAQSFRPPTKPHQSFQHAHTSDRQSYRHQAPRPSTKSLALDVRRGLVQHGLVAAEPVVQLQVHAEPT
jgi:hypothetical protein